MFMDGNIQPYKDDNFSKLMYTLNENQSKSQ